MQPVCHDIMQLSVAQSQTIRYPKVYYLYLKPRLCYHCTVLSHRMDAEKVLRSWSDPTVWLSGQHAWAKLLFHMGGTYCRLEMQMCCSNMQCIFSVGIALNFMLRTFLVCHTVHGVLYLSRIRVSSLGPHANLFCTMYLCWFAGEYQDLARIDRIGSAEKGPLYVSILRNMLGYGTRRADHTDYMTGDGDGVEWDSDLDDEIMAHIEEVVSFLCEHSVHAITDGVVMIDRWPFPLHNALLQ